MQGPLSGFFYAQSNFWWHHPHNPFALLPGYTGIFGKKEKLKQPFLSAFHAQGVHWLQIWDIFQNKQERDVPRSFFTENETLKRRVRPPALHPVTFWMGVPPTATKLLHWKWSVNIASNFPSYIESGIFNAIHEVRAREWKGKKAEKRKSWILLDGELLKQRGKKKIHWPQFFAIFYILQISELCPKTIQFEILQEYHVRNVPVLHFQRNHRDCKGCGLHEQIRQLQQFNHVG